MKLQELPDKLFKRIRVSVNGGKKPLSQKEKWEAIDQARKTYKLTSLVESGTFLGDTVDHFKDKFEQIYSIELAPDLFEAARKRFSANKNISLIYGDSGQKMKQVLCQLSGPALFWLDGHYSSEFHIGEVYIRTARGDKETPIAEELKTILSAGAPHVILIDDARLFGIGNDYPSIGQIKKIVRALKPGHEVRLMQDIIAILPKVSS
jgi:hypothetical protein